MSVSDFSFSSSQPAASPARLRWLHSNLPVFVQPSHDSSHGNRFLCLFYEFYEVPNSNEKKNSLHCALHVIFESEASYSRRNPLQFNRFGTFLYRSWNHYKYKRTADIDHLEFVNIKIDDDEEEEEKKIISSSTESDNEKFSPLNKIENSSSPSPSWFSLKSRDFSGTQLWNCGNKVNSLMRFYSLVHHYFIEIPQIYWMKDKLENHQEENLENSQIQNNI